MPKTSRKEIVVDREALLKYIEENPISVHKAREINKLGKPPKELSEKQKAHIQQLVERNRERFQKLAQEKIQNKDAIEQKKKELIEQKMKEQRAKEATQGKMRIAVRKRGIPDVDIPDEVAYAPRPEEEIEEEEEEEEEVVERPKKTTLAVKRAKAKTNRKKYVEETTDEETTDDSDMDTKPKRIQKMVKSLKKIDETLQKTNTPVNPYLTLLNNRIRR